MATQPKVILITGASSGIGKSAAERLLKKGQIVYAAARRLERMKELEQLGARLVRLDVTSEESMSACVQQILVEQGRIDVLVNNAGYGSYGAVECVPIEEARAQFEVNVFGLARLCQLVLPAMRQQKDGRIVNIASMAGHFCEPRGAWYHATKYSVEALSDCMRMELKPFGVKVILIEPGAIASSWSDIAMENLEKVSAGTVYEQGATHHAGAFRWVYSHTASPADVIGKRIERASLSRCPRIRYRAGTGSHTIIFLKHILPTRWFDAIVSRVL